MPKLKDMHQQADRLLGGRYLELGEKAQQSRDETTKIRSISTFNRYKQALGQAGKWAYQHYGITRLDHLTPEIAKAYLQQRVKDGIGQKQLHNDRRSMEFVVGKLERVKTDKPQKLEPRAYTPEQAESIAARQAPHNALATKVAYNAGLRAHELLTLRRADEGAPSTSRAWRDDRFHGREGERYLVTGKGGLVRQVMINPVLTRELETRRLDTPMTIRDRGINYAVHYDLGGGNSWSGSFGQISKRELGWSEGAHGLRHGHAQERFEKLLNLGYDPNGARGVLSQELGHFRYYVVDTYLR
jgi:integrase